MLIFAENKSNMVTVIKKNNKNYSVGWYGQSTDEGLAIGQTYNIRPAKLTHIFQLQLPHTPHFTA